MSLLRVARFLTAILLVAGCVLACFGEGPDVKPAAAGGVPEKSAAGFYHPGVLVNRAQLEFVKSKVAAGAEPWKSAFEAAKTSDIGSLTYTPHPWKACNCGSFSRPDI